MKLLRLAVFFGMAMIGLTAKAAVILQYHHVDSSTPSITSIDPELFAQHMEYLDTAGFVVMPLHEILEQLFDGNQLPSKVVAITFDDGYSSIADQALPVLERYGYPFTIFVNPDLVGTSSDFLNWDDLRNLKSAGGTIANHTLNHPHLIRLEPGEAQATWESRIRYQIEEAESTIQSQMGESPGLLAYPYGEYNTAIENIVAELELFGFAQHSGAFDARVDRQAIPRFAFGGSYGDMEDFITKVNTLALPWVEITALNDGGSTLEEPLLPSGVARPQLRIELESEQLATDVNCYASGQGALEINREGNSITTRPNADLPVGRSRINCTAPSAEPGRFYWYSQFFMRKQPDGSWYSEY